MLAVDALRYYNPIAVLKDLRTIDISTEDFKLETGFIAISPNNNVTIVFRTLDMPYPKTDEDETRITRLRADISMEFSRNEYIGVRNYPVALTVIRNAADSDTSINEILVGIL